MSVIVAGVSSASSPDALDRNSQTIPPASVHTADPGHPHPVAIPPAPGAVDAAVTSRPAYVPSVDNYWNVVADREFFWDDVNPMPSAVKVLFCILEGYARYDPHVWLGNKELATKAGLTVRGLQANLAILEQLGWIRQVYADPLKRTRLGIILLQRTFPRLPSGNTPERLAAIEAIIRAGRADEKFEAGFWGRVLAITESTGPAGHPEEGGGGMQKTSHQERRKLHRGERSFLHQNKESFREEQNNKKEEAIFRPDERHDQAAEARTVRGGGAKPIETLAPSIPTGEERERTQRQDKNAALEGGEESRRIIRADGPARVPAPPTAARPVAPPPGDGADPSQNGPDDDPPSPSGEPGPSAGILGQAWHKIRRAAGSGGPVAQVTDSGPRAIPTGPAVIPRAEAPQDGVDPAASPPDPFYAMSQRERERFLGLDGSGPAPPQPARTATAAGKRRSARAGLAVLVRVMASTGDRGLASEFAKQLVDYFQTPRDVQHYPQFLEIGLAVCGGQVEPEPLIKVLRGAAAEGVRNRGAYFYRSFRNLGPPVRSSA